MIPRLYIEASLATGAAAPLTAAQVHYLKNVLRRAAGDEVRLFNGKDGEFAGVLTELKKKGGLVSIIELVRAQEIEPDLTLYFAPIKRGPLETVIQKATEIGVARLVPVITERTVASKTNTPRLQAIAIEAAEQCGRLTVPSVDEPIKLSTLINDWTESRRMLFCDEAGDDANEEWGGREGRALPLLAALNEEDSISDPWAILTGPEGGFTPEERAMLHGKPFVTPATLGPRILRADTAAIAALVLWQAALGDWRRR